MKRQSFAIISIIALGSILSGLAYGIINRTITPETSDRLLIFRGS